MDSQTVVMALLAGFIIYAIIELDKRYLSTEAESKKLSSLRIASLVALLVYGVVAYFKCSMVCKREVMGMGRSSPSMSASIDKQQIMSEPF